jgi:hypothetical protein
MKISEIKSDEVRNEAVRLAQLKEVGGCCKSDKDALSRKIETAFDWSLSSQKGAFWFHIANNNNNTPDLKLPEKNPSE